MAGAPARHVTRSVLSLLDAACYLERFPDDDPHIVALDTAGCFRGGAFDPGPEGWPVVTEWQLADQTTADPADLIAELVRAAPARRRTPQTAQALLDRHPPRTGFLASNALKRPADQRQDLHHHPLRDAPCAPDHGELAGERDAGPIAPAHRVGQVDRAA
jgi:hypothetical protein